MLRGRDTEMTDWIHASSPTEFATSRLWEIVFAAPLTALIYLLYRRYPALYTKVIAAFRVSRRRTTLCILAAMLCPLVFRLALLPWIPPPEPHVHDEFGHLLVAETLLAGRLANPPHPLWRHLETIYVLQHPSYASIYPMGQGIILAAGQRLMGHPWAGVLLATVLMCGAISWMLFGCLPPIWAAIGGLLAAFALASRWEDVYWGGAFCAFGGALLFGALCRLRASPSKVMGLIVGLGWSIVWLTRPFESLLLLVFTWGFIGALMIRTPQPWRKWLGPIVLALCVQISTGFVTALHNHAVTGSFTTIPYQLSQRVYGVPQTLLGQRPIEEPVFRYKELRDMYQWQREVKDSVAEHPFLYYVSILHKTWAFFVTPWYSVPIVLVLLLRDRDVFIFGGMIAAALTMGVLYPFFSAHYLAAYSAVIFFLIVRGLMVLYEWSFRGKAVGRLAVLFLMMGGLGTGLRIASMSLLPVLSASSEHPDDFRDSITGRLMGLGERHVVFMRYGAHHNSHLEWVYNSADIDGSRIVWCRTLGRADDAEVTRYYKDRQAWVVDVEGGAGGEVARLSSYQPEASGWGLPGEGSTGRSGMEERVSHQFAGLKPEPTTGLTGPGTTQPKFPAPSAVE